MTFKNKVSRTGFRGALSRIAKYGIVRAHPAAHHSHHRGMPIALAVGLWAACGRSTSSTMIAAVGAWLGGWVDALIQRITEVNMPLPLLPFGLVEEPRHVG